eukprot:7675308-Alexandrium_andersonii.AAC.1
MPLARDVAAAGWLGVLPPGSTGGLAPMPAAGPRDVAVQARRARTPGTRRHASPDADREQARDHYQRYP